MSGAQLGRLGMNDRAGQVRDERLFQGMEIGVVSSVVDVGYACPLEVLAEHLGRSFG
jgi:hypothetical protein